MGGSNTQAGKSTGTPETEAATYAQIKKQGMSGAADESLGKYAGAAKSFVKDLIGKPAEIPVAQNEEQAIEQLNKQGMSGMADESLAHYARMIKSLVSGPSNPNYNRDIKKIDPESAVKKEDINLIKSPMSSYDAIDAGLR